MKHLKNKAKWNELNELWKCNTASGWVTYDASQLPGSFVKKNTLKVFKMCSCIYMFLKPVLYMHYHLNPLFCN